MKYITTIIFIFYSVIIYAQNNQGLALLVSKTDGVSIGYCLDNFPVLALDDDVLYVSYQGITNSYYLKELESLSYVKEDDIPNVIKDVYHNDFSVLFYERGIVVHTKLDQKIVIYDIKGNEIFSKMIDNNVIFINTTCFSQGLYILNQGKHNFKFYVK